MFRSLFRSLFHRETEYNFDENGDENKTLLDAVAWLVEKDPKSRLAYLVRTKGSSSALVYNEGIDKYWREIEYNLIVDTKLARHKEAITRAAATRREADRRSSLGIKAEQWRTGRDLTPFLESIMEEARRHEVADCIGDDLVGLLYKDYPKQIADALFRFAGPSGHLNGLFSDPERRKNETEDWGYACTIMHALKSVATRFPIVLWHGYGHPASALRETPVGATFPGREGFLHCSLWATEALKHSVHNEHREGRPVPPMLGRIHLPASSPAIYRSGLPREYEVFLPSETAMKVKAKHDIQLSTAKNEIATVLDLEPLFRKDGVEDEANTASGGRF